MRKLIGAEIDELCRQQPGWEHVGGELMRTFGFADFVTAMVFVNRVAALAEKLGHHPDIDIRYNKVRLGLVTHDAGGISTRDAEFVGGMSGW